MASDKGEMMNKWKLTLFLLVGLLAGSVHALTPLSETDMAQVSGQGLIVSETITGTGPSSGFDFIRMGLDARFSLNANIDKLQLGCGGFNESIISGCDIDFDYVRLMGRNGSAPGDTQPGEVGSDFVLTRPYIELATVGTGTTREVVGLKIGAQQADGFMSIGRTYADGEENLENGGTCGPDAGNDALACHSGINSISGYLNAELSAQVKITTAFGTEQACFGNTTTGVNGIVSDGCGASDALYRELIGTRMTEIDLPSTQLKLDGGFLSWLGIDEAYASVTEAYRFIHGFALVDTSDFGLSFQREQIAWPNYDKTSYSKPANAGWWLNVPDVKAMNIKGDDLPYLTLAQAISALSAPGLSLSNIELGQQPADNCYGTTSFC